MKKQNRFAIDLTKVDTLILDKEIFDDKEKYESILNDFKEMGFDILENNESFGWAKIKNSRYKLQDDNGTPYTKDTGDIEIVKIPYLSKTLVVNVFEHTDRGKLYQSDTITYSCENYQAIERAFKFIKKLNVNNKILYVDNGNIVYVEPNNMTKETLNKILKLDTELFLLDKDENKKATNKLINVIQNKYDEAV